ncbi:hypothetical protein DPMN_078659 [Dreissena polymorpha]|uniref:Uncharacterized protein n=1 Tax=Dreissena polymorpha TaxID=45954 RepID=A0A9D4BHP9_DREPO|nr:hypothetical protein DPMN_078659 [Dreissena polymorpha]
MNKQCFPFGRQNSDADGLNRAAVDANIVTAFTTVLIATVEEEPLCFSIADPSKIAELEQETIVPDAVMQTHALSSKDWRRS